jgi:molybdopterin synthase sulfur carrier subunit
VIVVLPLPLPPSMVKTSPLLILKETFFKMCLPSMIKLRFSTSTTGSIASYSIIFPMAVIVRVPTPLRRLTNGQGEVQVEALTIREAVEKLEGLYPGFKERLLDENGELRKFVNIYLNDEDIRFLKGIDTELKDGDVLSIVPAIAGGF